jgi:Spy/CpxP family protein refolding chaperone
LKSSQIVLKEGAELGVVVDEQQSDHDPMVVSGQGSVRGALRFVTFPYLCERLAVGNLEYFERQGDFTMKKLLFLTAALAAVLWGCQRPTPDQMVDHVVSHVRSALSLDAAQNQKLTDLVQAVRQIMAQHQTESAGDRDQIGALLTAPTLDQARLRTLIDNRFTQLEAGHSQDLDVVIPKLAVFLDSLTPDQKKKLQGLFEQFKGRMGGWK